MKLILPYPPSVNRYWTSIAVMTEKFRQTGKPMHLRIATFPTAENKKYTLWVREYCEKNLVRPLQCAVSLRVRFYRPQRSGDLDNFLKVPIDALRGWAYVDDKQIVEIHATRHEDKLRPRVEIEVTPVGTFAEQEELPIGEALPL